jgi:hypothetical protein
VGEVDATPIEELVTAECDEHRRVTVLRDAHGGLLPNSPSRHVASEASIGYREDVARSLRCAAGSISTREPLFTGKDHIYFESMAGERRRDDQPSHVRPRNLAATGAGAFAVVEGRLRETARPLLEARLAVESAEARELLRGWIVKAVSRSCVEKVARIAELASTVAGRNERIERPVRVRRAERGSVCSRGCPIRRAVVRVCRERYARR